MVYGETKKQLIKAIIKTSRLVKIYRKEFKQRCDRYWLVRIKSYNLEQLARELKGLFAACGLKGIVKIYNQFLRTQNSTPVIQILHNFLQTSGLEDAYILRHVMNHFATKTGEEEEEEEEEEGEGEEEEVEGEDEGEKEEEEEEKGEEGEEKEEQEEEPMSTEEETDVIDSYSNLELQLPNGETLASYKDSLSSAFDAAPLNAPIIEVASNIIVEDMDDKEEWTRVSSSPSTIVILDSDDDNGSFLLPSSNQQSRESTQTNEEQPPLNLWRPWSMSENSQPSRNQVGGGREEEEAAGSVTRFTIIEQNSSSSRRFRMNTRKFVIRFDEPPAAPKIDVIAWLEEGIRDLHAHLVELSDNDQDRIGVTIHSELFSNGAGWLSFRPVQNFFADDLWTLIAGLTQSNENFRIDESFSLQATYVNVPVGKARTMKRKLGVDIIKQNSFVKIYNDNDNLCLPRSLVVGECHVDLVNKPSEEQKKMWNKIRDSRRQLQKSLAKTLTQKVGVIIPCEGCGIREIKKFQSYYARKNIGIVVYDKQGFADGEAAFFDGRSQIIGDLYGTIFLCYDPNLRHYDTILNLTGAATSVFFCSHCNKGYKYIDSHRCEKICSCCYFSPTCDINQDSIKCPDCRRIFYGNSCFLNHKKDKSHKNKKICDILKRCERCNKLLNSWRDTKHKCGHSYCKCCKVKHDVNMPCYMYPIQENKNSKKVEEKPDLFLFYDFECRQEDTHKSHHTTKVHTPNLCVVQQVCTNCIDLIDIKKLCNTCGMREYVFRQDPVKSLIDLSCREMTKFAHIICIAHNGGGYDIQFILRDIIDKYPNYKPDVILKGQSIVMLQVERTKFIDSLNYFHMKLSALPATFNFAASKGYFPHFFNTLENQSYVGDMPDASFYGPDTMSEKDRTIFYKWYNEQKTKNYNFNFQEEIVKYCKVDVEILRRSCMIFRKIFLEVGKTDPFVSATTIASACSHVFRKIFLKPYKIGLVPHNGYRRADNQSQKAIEWLLQCEKEVGRNIIHAGRAREYYLPEGFKVDGYLPLTDPGTASTSSTCPSDKGIVYEFHGCYYHGCPKCFKTNRNKPRRNAAGTFDEAFENTIAKISKIKSFGYNVKEMWECEFDQIKAENSVIREFVSNHPLINKMILNPRDAFFGGRTENFVTFHDIKNDEKINYIDICSLYPSICKFSKFPLGHPEIYVGGRCRSLTNGNNNDLSRVEGLVKCKVLAPKNLYLPVLPVKMNGRLLFALCRSCCEETRKDYCNHTIDGRIFSGTWVADELRKAIELGYEIVEIFVIWQYKITQYDRDSKSGGLFADYINTFLKLKQQASGWPEWCVDDASKNKYLSDYEIGEGISLDKEKIEKNPGLRSVSKMALNTLWGKFGQRSSLRQTDIVRTRETLLDLMTDDEKEIDSILPANEEVLFVNWLYRDEAVVTPSNTSVVIAAFVTAQARLKLYSYMEKLQERVLYVDTDSCIFLSHESKTDEYMPPLGSLLGDMTDELECFGKDSYIKTFISGGPKFYCFKVVSGETGEISECCKVKGITLNFKNSEKVNFNSIKKLVENKFDQSKKGDNNIKLNFRAIRRLPGHTVVTRDETKTCAVVLEKRIFFSHEKSVPFGYVKQKSL